MRRARTAATVLLMLCIISNATLVAQTPDKVAQTPDKTVQHFTTRGGVEYGVWNRTSDEPAPVLIVLASTIDTTLGNTYYRQCGNELAEHGWISVSIDLPCHGKQEREGEPSGLSGWSHRFAKNEDIIAEFNTRLSEVLDHLIESSVADPERIAVCGTSRGGFLALHFAAHDDRAKCAAAFAPVSDPRVVNEFVANAKHPLVENANLENQADRLAGRPIWIVIGDQDQRVGTSRAVALAQKLTSVSREKNVDSRVELHVMPEPRGHATPRGSSTRAADWILDQFPQRANPDDAAGGLNSDSQRTGDEPPYFDETKAITLFAFDDISIPFTQNLKLEMQTPQRHPANPVVTRGPDGTCDSWAVQFYGSVIRDPARGKFRMWYVAVSKAQRHDAQVPRSVPWRVAYAESDDGIHWTKPNLGLVESAGNTNNNLVKLDPQIGVLNLKVLYEPDDPNPEHRYKMGAHVWFPKNDRRLGTLAPYVSADGLTWALLTDATPIDAEMPENATVIPPLHFEPVGGLYKWAGLYHLSGQNAIVASRPYHGRVSRTYISSDFANWSRASAIQFVRSPQHKLLGPGKSRIGEQTHEGISVWNRGNVLVGISGMWHGTPEWKDLTIDLGFVVSNNGIQFREPMQEHIFLKRGVDGQWDQGGLLQAQGFENVGARTLIYYGAWDPRSWENSPPRGGVGIVTLPRDRFAFLAVDKTTEGPGDYQMTETVSSFLTNSLRFNNGEAKRLFVNAEGLGDQATLRIELLDHQLRPIPQSAGDNAAIVRSSGFQTPIVWNRQSQLIDVPDRVRMRVTFEGRRKSDIHFSAIYVR